MFSNKLFNHRYDIDTLILALCNTSATPSAAPTTGIWLVDTLNGTVTPAPLSPHLPPEDTHHHLLHSLNLATVLSLIPHPQQKQEIQNNCNNVTNIPHLLHQHHLGAILYPALKEIALDWLDERQLIPPSMRHIKQQPGLNTNPFSANTPQFSAPPKKVTIS